MSAHARVLVVYTGGTLGMLPSEPGNAASPLRPGTAAEVLELIRSSMPRLGTAAGIEWQLATIPGQAPYDSSDINAEHWLRIAAFIEGEYSNWDGFVVIHGTDTMAYTASGLSFLFENLGKPVVLTGSQLPLSHERTDALANLANSLHIAGFKATRLPCIPEVIICFGHFVLRGNRARKVSTADLNGFDSPNYPALGLLRERVEIYDRLLRPQPDGPFSALKDLSTHVMDLTLFPGMRAEHLSALLSSPDLKGLLVRSFGAGNIMNDAAILSALQDAARRGVAILNITQCLRGRVEMGLYENSSALLDIGVATGSDMTPEAGLAKMMWALATAPDQAAAKLQVNLRGEQSTDLLDVHYDVRATSPGTRFTCPGPHTHIAQLERAVLRLSGVRFPEPGLRFRIAVRSNGRIETIEGASTPSPSVLVKDITGALDAGNDLSLCLESNVPFAFDGARLLLTVPA